METTEMYQVSHAMKKAILTAGLLSISGMAIASPYATEVVDYHGTFNQVTGGNNIYRDVNAVLGKPTTIFQDMWGESGPNGVKIVEPAWNVGVNGEKLITTIKADEYITVTFDHRVEDDPNNPFGLDLIVFGNAFFVGNGGSSVYESTNMDEYTLGGGIFAENVTVSVSQDGENWYTYEDGPYGDNAFPTQCFDWDSESGSWTNQMLDYTKPVNPDVIDLVVPNVSAATVIDAYDGSAGGTGFDLAESGFAWIQYVKVESSGGEIDGFADVAAVPEPASLMLLGIGGVMVLSRRKGMKR